MDKKHLIERIIEKLSADLALLTRAAKTAHEAATHEETIPDNKYDTLALEASYVAQGQANRALEIGGALEAYRKLEPQSFGEAAPIRLTALIRLESGNGAKLLFLASQAGGLKVVEEGREIVVITPRSPAGKALLGKCEGDVVEMRSAQGVKEFEIVEVR